jgi:hypothetical protein
MIWGIVTAHPPMEGQEVDWKRLVHFALLGSSDLEQYAVLLVPKGLSPLNWLDDFLYLPEVLYVLFFILLICFGPGKFSVDYWLAGKLLR